MEHELKTWPVDFEAISDGRKTHEARKADRAFARGDTLILREWIPSRLDACDWQRTGLAGHYTGRQIAVEVTHLTRGEYGLPADLAIMSIRLLSASELLARSILEGYEILRMGQR